MWGGTLWYIPWGSMDVCDILGGQGSGVSSVCGVQEEKASGGPGFGSENMNGEGQGALDRGASVRWDTHTSFGVLQNLWVSELLGSTEMARHRLLAVQSALEVRSKLAGINQASGTSLQPQP